jgi:hypothetical protein
MLNNGYIVKKELGYCLLLFMLFADVFCDAVIFR